jgi:archaellum component FlaC
VTVERHLERKGDGIVVTLELSADVRGPAEVDLVDEFPPGLPVEQAGFNVDREPDDGEVSLERVELHHVIEAATETVVYAIRLSAAADDVAFDPPTIRDVSLPGVPEPDVPDDGDSDGEASTPGTSAGGEPTDAGAVDEPDDPGGPAVEGQVSTDGEGLPEELSLDGSGGATTDEAAEQVADAEASRDGLEADDLDPIESALERAEVAGEGRAGARNGNGSPREPATDGAPAGDGTAGDPARSGGPAGGPPGSDGAAVPANPEEGTVPRSVRLKLDRLSARVEEFAAYAGALEGIIDRHGTVPEILDDIEADLADADDDLADVRAEVESLDERHVADVRDVRDRIDALEERFQDARREVAAKVDDVRGDLEGVREDVADVDAVRSELRDVRSAVDALGGRVSDHEDDVEDLDRTVRSVASDVSEVSRNVKALRSELQALQNDVDQLLRFREILADVFGGPVRRATEGGRDPFGDAAGWDRDADRAGTDDGAGTDDRGVDGDAERDGPSSTDSSS